MSDNTDGPLKRLFKQYFLQAYLLAGIVVMLAMDGDANVRALGACVTWGVAILLEKWLPYRREWAADTRERTLKDTGNDVIFLGAAQLVLIPVSVYLLAGGPLDLLGPAAALREALGIPAIPTPENPVLRLLAAMLVLVPIELVNYWVHRVEHRSRLFWRIHGVHHHATRLYWLKNFRDHPLEVIFAVVRLLLIMGFLGIPAAVIGVTLWINLVIGIMVHANVDLRPGRIFGALFVTPAAHRVHHSIDLAQSNTNFGDRYIIFDRLFGTFSGEPHVEQVGNGTGKDLPLPVALGYPFLPWKAIEKL